MVMENPRFFKQGAVGNVVCVGVPTVRECAQMVPLKVWAVLVLEPRSSISRFSGNRGEGEMEKGCWAC